MKVFIKSDVIKFREYEVVFEFKNSKIAELITKLNLRSCELSIFSALLATPGLSIQELVSSTNYSESSTRNAVSKMLKLDVIKKIDEKYLLNVLDDIENEELG